MKISHGRPTFMKSLKKVSSNIGTLKRVRSFVSRRTAIKIYTKVLSSNTLITVVLYGMARPNSLVRNFKIVLQELSSNLALILVPDFLLTCLVGTIYRLEGLNKGCSSALINSPQFISATCLPQEHRISIQRKN